MASREMKELPPKEVFWHDEKMHQIDGFWYLDSLMESIAAFRSQFQPRTDDILLTSIPKTGTTWLIALCHSILHRHDNEEEEEDSLMKMNPHELVPTMDISYLTDQVQEHLKSDHTTTTTSPRFLHTHLPYSCLPEAVRSAGSSCKLVHVARNPKDTVVSMWHFYNKIFGSETTPDVTMESAVEGFCGGVIPYGPFYEHVVEYWEESRRRPEKVLFLKYEELCRAPNEHVRRLASFLGKPFGSDEDGDAEVEKVLWRSSLNRLKELEVNKSDEGLELAPIIPKSSFFRKGTVGGWKNYLTPQMAHRIDLLTEQKLQDTILSLDDF
ncbi:unnamed protein product [Linum trigynum]|uniref:Sulfotransferase n=1 Tax=Linum trigynum TaxID=586398 RepID=A0AAV2EGB8_9ROSI